MANLGPISQYDIIRKLARGGMGEVYLARQTGIEGFAREVVLKRIHSNYSENTHFIKMFLQEARIAAILDHPNIVQIHELGKKGEDYFIVMEYVRGLSLSRLLKAANRALPIHIAIQIAEGVSAGLQYAHDKKDAKDRTMNLVHRDISPPNILLSTSGSIKITDFGIAKVRSSVTQTQAGVIKGKYSYISPEQARGDKASRRSDIYSLGLVLYEMTTGVRAYPAGEDALVLRSVSQGLVPPPNQHVPKYPEDLKAVVMRALALDPRNRYTECQEMQEDLHDLLVDRQVVTTPAKLGRFVRKLVEQVEASEFLIPGQPMNLDLEAALESSSGAGQPAAVSLPAAVALEVERHEEESAQSAAPETLDPDEPVLDDDDDFDEDAETIMVSNIDGLRPGMEAQDMQSLVDSLDASGEGGVAPPQDTVDVPFIDASTTDRRGHRDLSLLNEMAGSEDELDLSGTQTLDDLPELPETGPGSLTSAAGEITAEKRARPMLSFLLLLGGLVIVGAVITWYLVTRNDEVAAAAAGGGDAPAATPAKKPGPTRKAGPIRKAGPSRKARTTRKTPRTKDRTARPKSRTPARGKRATPPGKAVKKTTVRRKPKRRRPRPIKVATLTRPQTKPNPTPAPVKADLLTLQVNTEPETVVYLGKKRLGLTPLLARVPRGKLTLALRNRKLGIWAVRKLEPSGSNVAVRYILHKGILGFQFAKGKVIRLNGKKLGTAPLSPISVYEGHYMIMVTDPETKAQKRYRAAVTPNRTTWVGSN